MWMLISNFRSFKRGLGMSPNQGFTLVEILVVLLIVTILVGITVPRLPGFIETADFDLEARRLELLLNMARSEAVLDSMEFGFDLTDYGYEFLLYDDSIKRWRRQEAPYQPRRLPEGLTLDIQVVESDFNLEGENQPTVLILSSGETTPVNIIIESDGQYLRILKTDGYEPFKWLEDNEG